MTSRFRTSVTTDLAPDHAAFAAHCRRLLDQGCDGVALLGTTGEANSFSTGERKALLETAVGGGITPDRLLPATGVTAWTETLELTKHALSLGVNRVVMLPPFFYKAYRMTGCSLSMPRSSSGSVTSGCRWCSTTSRNFLPCQSPSR